MEINNPADHVIGASKEGGREGAAGWLPPLLSLSADSVHRRFIVPDKVVMTFLIPRYVLYDGYDVVDINA